MNITMFKPEDLRNKAAENGWSPYTVKIIKRIIKKYYDKEKSPAQSILLFFKEDKRLHSFMSLISLNDTQNNKKEIEVTDEPSDNGEARIIGVEPYHIGNEKITKKEMILIYEIMRTEYSYIAENVFRISDNRNHQEVIIDVPITQETIEFGLNRINAIKEYTGKIPKNLVKAVDAIQHEFLKRDKVI